MIMSHYVTPFLVLNLGSEMLFVVAQRLQAQNIPQERSTLVLEEIISSLISKPLAAELIKPQASYSQDCVREIIEDITQSSIMRLDAISMSKLWDLITMVFKWQVTLTQDIIGLTLRHLYEIESYVINQETQLQLQKVQTLIENFNKIFNKQEKQELHDEAAYWLRDYNVRVSLLLRMGLQAADGSFITNNLDPIAEDMLRNLGENIFAVTQNGRILENRERYVEEKKQQPDVNELQLFVDEIIGERKLSTGSADNNILKLSINDEELNGNKNVETINNFDNIDIRLEDKKMQSLMNELNLNKDEEEEEKSFQDDLLDMIGKD